MAALPITAISSGPARPGVPTVAFLAQILEGRGSPIDLLYRDSILEGLAEQGFVAPRNLRWIETYSETGDDLQLLARRVADEGPDVIVTRGSSVRPVIAAVAGRVPVVYGFSGDPIAAGMADSLSRPRGNATGVTQMFAETNAKRIELLKELAPSSRRLALISGPSHPGEPAEIDVCRRAVASIGIDMIYLPVFSAQDVEQALIQASSENADALVAPPAPVLSRNRRRLSAWALEQRIPFASGWAMYAESGGLMTYGPNLRESYRRVGYFAARVLAGAKPADLPIEQPSRFELVINTKTARALGTVIPPSILVSADVVIE